MKSLTQLVSRGSKAIIFGLAGAVLYGAVSCDEALFPAMTDAQKTTLAGQSLMILGSLDKTNSKEGTAAVIGGSLISSYGQMQHDLEVANAGKTQVIVNNNPPVNQNNYSNIQEEENKLNEFLSNLTPEKRDEYIRDFKNLDRTNLTSEQKQALDEFISKLNRTPTGFFMYRKWVDFNGDGMGNRDEYIGLNNSPIDVSNLDYLHFSFYGDRESIYDGEYLDFKLYDMNNGNLIEDYTLRCDRSKIQNFPCDSKYFLNGKKYKAVLNIGTLKTLSLDFEVIK